MGVYSLINRTNEIELNASVEECVYEPGMEGAMAIVAESEANYNAIMQAIGVAELCVYESTGKEMVYESSNIKGFFGKVKEFFLKMWEKIKGLFQKFFAMFDQYVKSDKEFINKYRNVLLKVNTRNFEYKGFKYTNLDLNIGDLDKKIDEVIPVDLSEPVTDDTAEDILKKLEEREEIVEKMRAIAIPGENTLTSSEFTKELYKLFRNSEDTKETLENISVSELLLNIQGNNELEKIAKKAYKELEKTIKEEIKELDKAEKKMVKSMPESGELRGKQIRISNAVISLKKEKLNILNIVNGAKLTALKDANRQSKAICIALLNYKPKNEGYDFGDDDYVAESGFLGNVVLR